MRNEIDLGAAALADPERRLALAYAPARARDGMALLWSLDERLGDIVRSTTEPMIGQMRLTWWHGAMAALNTAPPPAEPLLRAMAATLPRYHLTPAALLPLVEGWEMLIEPFPLGPGQLDAYAQGRGAAAFDAATRMAGEAPTGEICAAGRGWALADLAFHCSDRATAQAALDAAGVALSNAPRRWPGRLRALGLLTVLARRDVAAGLGKPRRLGSPARLLRAVAHRVTGR
ncbi:MAG: hypothetical protein ABS87_06550 [Sphingomonas sp. SCN 67-18]|nr:squalene/phytoene synthase family protein [Sphingomonas sp. SCN 67-18]ODU21484.1 MAG: hypothetical protein ABS87_06550 [Sphingomonas sp. SCN 67-18]